MDDDRFARHELVPGWDQQRLAEARVIIAGVGALGNEVARLLAMAGAGAMVLCDPDRVERSNLSRTALFDEGDLGRNKAEASLEQLERLAPAITLEARPLPLIHGIGLGELRDADLVISCLDSRTARLQLAGRCNLVGAALLDGGTHPWGGEVRPYLDPGKGPCYGCSLTTGQRAVTDRAVSCSPPRPVGASGAVSALIGAQMATFALRHLMGLDVPVETLVVDATTGLTRTVSPCRDPGCPLHHAIDTVSGVPVTHRGTVGQLREVLPQDAVPLLWEPVALRRECLACGYEERSPGIPISRTCPRCGAETQDETVLDLTEIPDARTLVSLGIPPREIMAVRTGNAHQYIALADDEKKI